MGPFYLLYWYYSLRIVRNHWTDLFIAEDNRRKDRDNLAIALVVSSGKNQHNKSKFRKGVFCYNCSKEGHIKSECRLPPKNQGSGSSNKKSKTYYAHVAQTTENAEEYSFSDDYAFALIEDKATISLLANKGEV